MYWIYDEEEVQEILQERPVTPDAVTFPLTTQDEEETR